MSRDIRFRVLLPMDEYDSSIVYHEMDELTHVYGKWPLSDKYMKQLKVRSVYTSRHDIQEYLKDTYGLSDDEFQCYAVSYHFDCREYRLNGRDPILVSNEVYDSFEKEHVDEGFFIKEHISYAPDIYAYDVLSKLFENDIIIIDDSVIQRITSLIIDATFENGDDAAQHNDEALVEAVLDWNAESHGKLLLAAILMKKIADKNGGIAVMEYD